MQEITREKEITQVVTSKVYVAFDGKEFDSVNACLEYEEDQRREAALKRGDVEVFEYNGSYDITGSDYSEHEFLWVKPNTEDAVTALNEAYESKWADMSFAVDAVTCVVMDGGEVIYTVTLDGLMNDVKWFFAQFGYDVQFIEK